MKLRDAQRLEKSLRTRAGSLSWLASTGRTTMPRSKVIKGIPEHIEKDMLEAARVMGRHARAINERIEQVMEQIEVDL